MPHRSKSERTRSRAGTRIIMDPHDARIRDEPYRLQRNARRGIGRARKCVSDAMDRKGQAVHPGPAGQMTFDPLPLLVRQRDVYSRLGSFASLESEPPPKRNPLNADRI